VEALGGALQPFSHSCATNVAKPSEIAPDERLRTI
jgi:hypothetical protein